MTTTIKHNGKAKSIPGGMAIATAVSMITTFLLSGLIAYGLHIEKMTWEQAGYWIMGMLFSASFLGSKCAYAAIKHQRGLLAVMHGVIYWGMLLCLTALFFGGEFGAVWETACIIGAGCGTAGLISGPERKKQRRRIGRAYR